MPTSGLHGSVVKQILVLLGANAHVLLTQVVHVGLHVVGILPVG
jgi:hypothetical protein